MKSHSHNEIPHISQRSSLHHLLIAIAPLFILLSSQCTTLAGSATWAPSSGATAAYWNVASNWSPMIVPNGAADTATFAQNFTRSVFVSADIEVNGITFASSMFPSAYAITANPGVVLRMSGVGVTNNSGVTQNFVTAVNASAAGAIVFSNNATAGASVIFTNNAGTATVAGGATGFLG